MATLAMTVPAPAEPAGRAGLAESDRRELFERDVIPCAGRLYQAALRLTRDPRDAEDLIQETLVRAYSGLHQFTPGTNLAAWLRRILTNAFLSSLRKRGREPLQVAGLDFRHEMPGAGPLAHAVRSAEAEALEFLGEPEVVTALRGLPPEYRVAVYLADVEGYPYREVAAIMGTPIGTVMSRLHRGRARLRVALARHAAANGYPVAARPASGRHQVPARTARGGYAWDGRSLDLMTAS